MHPSGSFLTKFAAWNAFVGYLWLPVPDGTRDPAAATWHIPLSRSSMNFIALNFTTERAADT